jgi:adenosine/AMP kinase
MEITTVAIENPNNMNLILGQSHFIKTVEDIHEAMVSTVPMAKFGLAFCEASDFCLVRHTGTDDEMLELAKKNAYVYPFYERHVSGKCFERDQKCT